MNQPSLNQPSQAITVQSQPTVNDDVETNQQTFIWPCLSSEHMSNSASDQAPPNTGSETYYHLANASVESNQQILNICSKRPIFNASTTDNHLFPSSSFAAMRPQLNQGLASNAGRFIQFLLIENNLMFIMLIILSSIWCFSNLQEFKNFFPLLFLRPKRKISIFNESFGNF